MEKQIEKQLNKKKLTSKKELLMADTISEKTKDTLYQKYIKILKQVLPHLGKDQDKIIYAQVMLSLKLEGIIGKNLTKEDSIMVNTIKDSIIYSDEKKETALLVAERILNTI